MGTPGDRPGTIIVCCQIPIWLTNIQSLEGIGRENLLRSYLSPAFLA